MEFWTLTLIRNKITEIALQIRKKKRHQTETDNPKLAAKYQKLESSLLDIALEVESIELEC